jgi:translation initiation factor 2 beta subunit (eIF-2beta)/eIF-5
MVKSVISPDEVNYNENRDISRDDMGHSTTIYQIHLFDTDVTIGLGKGNYSYSEKGIIHYSMYLVYDNKIKSKIGVFEVNSDNLINILDDDGDVELEKGNIILFPSDSIEKDILESKTTMSSDSEDDNELTGKNDNDTNEYQYPESEDEITEFSEDDGNTWIENFMKDVKYRIIDNEGQGDCFFAVLRDALKNTDKNTSVDDLRMMLSQEVSDEVFQEYRNLYMNFYTEYKRIESEMRKIKSTLNTLKKRNENAKNREESKMLLDQARDFTNKYKGLSDEKAITKSLMNEFDYMKNIDTIEKFADFILTNDYWADTWAISTLERLLNIKVVLLSEEAYNAGDIGSVLKCGQLNDSSIETQGGFEPDHYIMAGYNGMHYTLISYEKSLNFTFKTLPNEIKRLIIEKCMEKNAGPYFYINDFKELKEKLGLKDSTDDANNDDYLNNDIFNEHIVFIYHSLSNAKPIAGKGSGETIDDNSIVDFTQLNHKKNWRRMLDDSWEAPFMLHGKRWKTVQHYCLASQFKKGFPDFYETFSLDSDSHISKDLSKAKIAGSKTGSLKGKTYRDANIKIDQDYYNVGIDSRKHTERYDALEAKFTQNLDLKEVLSLTYPGKLVRFVKGRTPETDVSLMKVRKSVM